MRQSLIDNEKMNFMQVYKRLPIVIDRAKGCRIYDKDGTEYLDFLAGIAVNALGHSRKSVVDAVKAQVDKYMHVSNFYYQEPQIKLADKLVKMSGYEKVFFSNSGAEAIEGALKLVRSRGSYVNKSKLAAFGGGFHGRTYGSLSLMNKAKYKDTMGPFLQGVEILEYNDVASLKKKLDHNTCAVFLEFIQGEGGIRPAEYDFVRTLFELRDEYGFAVVADEVQTGVGRTGRFFAFEKFGVKPDVVAMAKGLGGGLPLGAILADEKLASIWKPGMHGSTYGGNPVACAAGLAVLEELESGLSDQIVEKGNYFLHKLLEIKREFPEYVEEIRGEGLMIGLALNFDAGDLVAALLKERIIANAASGNTLRIVPPFVVENADIDFFCEAVFRSLKNKRNSES